MPAHVQAPAAWVVLALALLPAAAGAQPVKPWTPAGADSITSLVADAKVRFRQAVTDSIDERSIVPFERVGQAARRLVRRLGRQNTLFAPSIEASLDSLGLDTDVVNDPDVPSVILVMVRNPFRRSEQAVGYLIWYRGLDLRMQGAAFPPCVRPRIKSWWSGRPSHPYSAAVVYETRSEPPALGFKYFELSGDGYYWDLVQYEGHGPELGLAGEAAFADMDRDGRPELLSFSPLPTDSILVARAPVDPLMREVIYTDRGAGFELHDARLVPGPLATLDLFLGLLREGKHDSAKRLLVDPTFLTMAIASGWAELRSPRNFVVDQQEDGQPWPDWLGARVTDRTGTKRWVFHFTLQEGHWLIRDWLAEESPRAGHPALPGPARVPPPDSTGGRKP
jgi:hypothetical protein